MPTRSSNSVCEFFILTGRKKPVYPFKEVPVDRHYTKEHYPVMDAQFLFLTVRSSGDFVNDGRGTPKTAVYYGDAAQDN